MFSGVYDAKNLTFLQAAGLCPPPGREIGTMVADIEEKTSISGKVVATRRQEVSRSAGPALACSSPASFHFSFGFFS
ncbi:MAG TPA: hypothetical protein DEB25_01525 [Desulfobulbaceae bacterium]|nr:hypothetical protein [Desulfobulbaceae bacterium]